MADDRKEAEMTAETEHIWVGKINHGGKRVVWEKETMQAIHVGTSYTLTSLYDAERALNRELVAALKEAQHFMHEFEETMLLNPNSWMREPFGKVNAALSQGRDAGEGRER